MSVTVSTYMAADSATGVADSATCYECRDCRKVFRRDVALRRHREVSHSADDDDVAAGRRYRCQFCRRPFTSRATLNAHLDVAHGTTSTTSGARLSAVAEGGSDSELLLVEDCCVDDEICIAADGGSAEFQTTTVTTEECDGRVAQKSDQVSQRSSVTSNSSSSDVPLVITAGIVTSVSPPNCNNNNNSQTTNKNVVVHPALAASTVYSQTAVRPILGFSNVVWSLPSVMSSTSMVQVAGVNGLVMSRRPQLSTTTAATVCSSSTVAAGPSNARHLSVSRATLEPARSAVSARGAAPQRVLAHAAVEQQKTPRSPREAEPFHGDARRPDDGPALPGFAPTTSSTQKIIVYVKTEPNNHQQIAYCAAESTTSGAGKGGAMPCQFVCPMCGRDFASEKYLSMHVSSIHRAANDVASVIALETAAAPTNVGHKVSVAGSPSNATDAPVASPPTASNTVAAQPSSTSVGGAKSHWTCNICQKTFAQNSSYKNHIRTHSDDRPYVCGICSIGFKERYHLKKHELFKHTTALNETCRICGKRFKDSTAVRAHERIHSDVRPYGCTLCGKTFKTSECLWHHENRSKTCGKMASRSKHVGVTEVVTVPRQRQRRAAVSHDVSVSSTSARQPPQPSTVMSPQFCTVEEDVKPDLIDLPPPAPECDQTEVDCTPAEVESTGQEVVEDSEVVIKTEPDCDLFDVNLNTMLETGDTSFVDFWQTFGDLDADTPDYKAFPPSPDAVCSSPDTTDDAESTRSADEPSAAICSTSVGVGGCVGVKRYDCARCDKRFASAATLAKHLQVHAEVRPHRCDVCDIGFKLKVHLKKHNLYRHSEEYPCECSICGKRFKDSSAVRLHERIHSTARPFQCLHCGKSFKTRENLWGHRNRGPCEQRSMSSMLVTSPPASNATATAAPQFVANNVRLFHSAEFGPILGVPVNAKLVSRDGERSGQVDERTATVALQQLNVNKSATTAPVSLITANSANNLRRVSAVRVGDTARTASKIPTNSVGSGSGGGGLSLVSVPTAVVTPIKREMINDPKLSTLVATTSASVIAGNFVLSAPNHAGRAASRKRSAVVLGTSAAYASPQKYLACAPPTDNDGVDKFANIQRLLSPQSGDSLLSPDTEQDLADALSALASSGTDEMVVEGDCLPPVGEAGTDWPSSTDFDEELDVRGDDWSQLVATSCDQLLTSADDDDALSDAGSLSDYRRLMTTSPRLGQSAGPGGDDTEPRDALESDTMWCNWAPDNDLGSLLNFGP